MAFFVYIVASKRKGTLYIGMTDDLLKRTWQHRQNVIAGFTRDHGIKNLFGMRPTKHASPPLFANAA